jgi:hypothetical protein
MRATSFILPLCLLFAIQASAQVFTNKEVGEKNAALIDSLKKTEYPYSLPILGAKATKAGYNLPYSGWRKSLIISGRNQTFSLII